MERQNKQRFYQSKWFRNLLAMVVALAIIGNGVVENILTLFATGGEGPIEDAVSVTEFEPTPTVEPTEEPTPKATEAPTEEPTPAPTAAPKEEPTPAPEASQPAEQQPATEQPATEQPATEQPGNDTTPDVPAEETDAPEVDDAVPTETPAATEQPTAEPQAPEADRTVLVTCNKPGVLREGETFELVAEPIGFEGTDFTLQWQYYSDRDDNNDGQDDGWQNAAGDSTGLTYKVESTRENLNTPWRVLVTVPK